MAEDDNHADSILSVLRAHADQLNAMCEPDDSATVEYELMSGALVWSDEIKAETPIQIIWALRYLYSYRTSVMLNQPRKEFKIIWDNALHLFPHWVGFRAERSQPTPELLEIYRRGDVSLRKCLRDLEREMDNWSKDQE